MFDFGTNWQGFSEQRLDARRLDQAVQSIQALLKRDTLTGETFLDIGCGSGLFSLAAHRLGAQKVVGIDINPLCVEVSKRNRDLLSPLAPIVYMEESALNEGLLNVLGPFSLVYAWGSLHHTGSMWQAIRNTARLVSPGGTLVLAIYNKHITSPAWQVIKSLYNRFSPPGRSLMALVFAPIIYAAKLLVTWRNPLEKDRGMDFWYDIIDWLGGYPYEYATPKEIQAFMESLGFRLVRLAPAQVPTGCNEFVLTRTS